MQILIIILIAIIAVLFGVGSSWLAAKEHKERKETERKLNEEKESAQNMAKANETKENANSGNLDNDVNYMGGVLHQLHQQAGRK